MLQILGLRTFINPKGEEKKFDKFHDQNWRANSVTDLFRTIETVLAGIPETERWNLFYTVANCGSGKREFESQSVLAFDLDGLDQTKGLESYIELVLGTLKIKRLETGIVNSGNGLHFLIGLKKKIDNVDFFAKNKLQYKALCEKINFALASAGLPGKCDTTVFDPRRILRLPETENRKPGKPSKRATLIQQIIKPIDFDLPAESGIPLVTPEATLNERVLKKYPHVDTDAVLSGCEFLKWMREKPNEVSEPQWYAALSIVGRMPEGRNIAHELSKGHRGYSEKETNLKLEQSMQASPPRTCENIESMSDKCQGCKFRGKVKSPILIHGEGYLATEFTGFHTITYAQNGNPKFTPNFADLKNYFERLHHYKGYGGSGMIYTWNGKFYEYLESRFLEQFANDHFEPLANNNMRSEFRNLILSTNLMPLEWFTESVQDYINFNNGVLNVTKRELLPHSADRGFLSVLPFDYDSKAKAPLFEKTLLKILCNDETLVKIMQEFFGYVLVNEGSWAQKALVMVGGGSNGKSTILNILKKVVGKNSYSALSIKEINESEYSRMLLDGKLVNIGEEAPSKSLVDSSMFKNIVTGGEVQMRHPYKESISKNVTCKQIFSCNEIPKTRDASHGFLRRLIIVPFNYKLSKADPDFDPHIEKKLSAELPGIFNWAMEGYERLKKQQEFTKSEAADQQLERFQEEIDTVRAWMKHHVKLYPLDSGLGVDLKTCDLYDSYSLQTKASNEIAITKVAFTRRLPELIKDYAERYARKRDEKKAQHRVLKNADLIADADIQDLPET